MAQVDNDNNANNNNENENENEKKTMDAAQLQTFKQLRVQSGALKRYTKELRSYMKELNELKSQLKNIINNNDDEKQNKAKKIEIKQQVFCILYL